MDIQLKIKELLSEKKISITEFSEKLDVSRNTVYNFFNKKYPIDVELLQKISDILEVPITIFFESNAESSPSFLKAELEKVKENLSTLIKSHNDLQAENDRLLQNNSLYTMLLESKTETASLLLNYISILFEDLLRLNTKSTAYIEKLILSEMPGLASSENKSLFNKYIESDELTIEFKTILSKIRSISKSIKGLNLDAITEKE